jgi:hypothetical protein
MLGHVCTALVTVLCKEYESAVLPVARVLCRRHEAKNFALRKPTRDKNDIHPGPVSKEPECFKECSDSRCLLDDLFRPNGLNKPHAITLVRLNEHDCLGRLIHLDTFSESVNRPYLFIRPVSCRAEPQRSPSGGALSRDRSKDLATRYPRPVPAASPRAGAGH